MTYKISLSAVKIPPETIPMMAQSLAAELIAQSEYVDRFEQNICDYVKSRYCVAISNGTMADAVAVAAMKVVYPKLKKVVVPALTFIAQPNSVRYNGLEVVFADVGEDWNLDVKGYFERFNPSDDALFFMTDLMGRPINDEDYHGMPMIEDACEGFASKRDGIFAGNFGLMGTYSFFPSHTISTGEGGAIVTDDQKFDSLCRSIRAHGSVSSDPMNKFHFPNFGYNARMTTMQAVIGMGVMLHAHEYVAKRREIFALMRGALGGFDEKGAEIVPHGYPIALASETARDKAMQVFLNAGVECRKFFSCIPLHEEQYKEYLWTYPNAEHISRTNFYLPCHQNMTPDDVEYISEIMNDIKERV